MMMTSDLRDRVTLPGPGETVLCAVSGGLDSMCLLDLLDAGRKSQPEFWRKNGQGRLVAAHFNHQLRERAGEDEAFVADFCKGRGIPLVTGRGDVRAEAAREGLSIEEAARKLRYAFLRKEAEKLGGALICTGHHAGDNAETMLLNLIRGTGLKGLMGIPKRQGDLYRPLLDVTREELLEYGEAHGVPWVEDETNADPEAAARNLIRLQVMPLLRELNPRAAENMRRTARILARENAFLEEAAGRLTQLAEPLDGGLGIQRSVLEEAPPGVAERVVLGLLEKVRGRRGDLGAVDAEAVLALARGREAKWELRMAHGLLVRGEGETVAMVRLTAPPGPVPIAPGRPAVFGGWTVTLGPEPQTGASYPVALPRGAALWVTAWRRSDRMTLPEARGERSLKRLFNDAGVRPWRRDIMPVLRVGEAPAAVPGVGVDQAFAPQGDTEGCFVTFYNHETAREQV